MNYVPSYYVWTVNYFFSLSASAVFLVIISKMARISGKRISHKTYFYLFYVLFSGAFSTHIEFRRKLYRKFEVIVCGTPIHQLHYFFDFK